MLRTNQSTTDIDLTLALENEEGTFLAQKAGQTFLVVAEKGHSIASMRAVGQVLPVPQPAASDPWFITKISNTNEGMNERYGRREQAAARDYETGQFRFESKRRALNRNSGKMGNDCRGRRSGA